MKTRKTFIVLISADAPMDGRKFCEEIEGTKLEIGGSVQATSSDVLYQLSKYFSADNEDFVEVWTLTDFMDAVNDQERDILTEYFMSYVFA